MQRLRFTDLRTSRLPGLLGFCGANDGRLIDYVNSAQERLLKCREAGDESWWGTWAEMAFLFTTTTPPNTCNQIAFITTPREVARIEQINICDRPMPLQNQFWEYLEFGNGRFPKQFRNKRHIITTYSRNNVPTFIDMTSPPQFIAAFPTSSADVNGPRVLIQGQDPAGNTIVSQDGPNEVQGQFLTLNTPFVQTATPFSLITGIQKDITQGAVQFMQVDPTTGAQILLLTMEPSETTAWYRRYLITPFPPNCCFGPNTSLCSGPPANPQTIPNTTTVTCLVKLELIPVVSDSDYCLIQNKEAIIEECQSIRYETMDIPNKMQLAQFHHTNAVRLLNGELTHYLGLDKPAIGFFPFGSAKLRHRQIGRLI